MHENIAVMGGRGRADDRNIKRRDIATWSMERTDHEFLAKIMHRRMSGRPLLSNTHVHRAAQFGLIRAMADAYLKDPDQKWVWFTLTWDTAVSWEREPDIDLVSLKAIANGHLRRTCLEGFGLVETDIWKNFAGEPERRLVSQIHFLGRRVIQRTFSSPSNSGTGWAYGRLLF